MLVVVGAPKHENNLRFRNRLIDHNAARGADQRKRRGAPGGDCRLRL